MPAPSRARALIAMWTTLFNLAATAALAPSASSHGLVLDALLATNVSDATTALHACHVGKLAHANATAADDAFRASAPRGHRAALKGCYYICILGRSVRPIPGIISRVPWNGKCFDGNQTIINRFGSPEAACTGHEALKAWYGHGESRADPGTGGAVVIEYHGLESPMRDELRNAGDAEGCGALSNIWLSKFYLGQEQMADFALLPVECGGDGSEVRHR